jgi:hypothetical protein
VLYTAYILLLGWVNQGKMGCICNSNEEKCISSWKATACTKEEVEG